MLDPYSVLEVSPESDDQTVKKAYRQLSKQYHPDNNLNNPYKDQAEEKFKMIQSAYEQIMDERSRGIRGGYGSASSQSSNSYNNYDYYRNNSNNYSNSSNNNSYNNSYSNSNSSRNNYRSNSNYNSSYNNGQYNNGQYNNGQYNNGQYNNSSNYYGNGSYNNGNSGYNNSSNGAYYGNPTGQNGTRYNNGYYRREESGNTNSSYGNYNSGYSRTYSWNGGQQSAQKPNFRYTTKTEQEFATATAFINNCSFYEALNVLDKMDVRNDLWYYLCAVANLGLGNNVTALDQAQMAYAMKPSNEDYAKLVAGIEDGTYRYRNRTNLYKSNNEIPKRGWVGIVIGAVIVNSMFGGACCGSKLCLFL